MAWWQLFFKNLTREATPKKWVRVLDSSENIYRNYDWTFQMWWGMDADDLIREVNNRKRTY